MKSDTDFVIAATVNVLTMRALAAGFGAPGWVGAMVAAASMGIATDPSADPQIAKIAGLISAPGALAVQVLTDKNVLSSNCCADCAAGKSTK